ncbi:GDSL esterase/lipase At2g42990-like isoform X1 [Herrania umbratica]|uniref:GDSL esterase/lipase At2g42990-like isoform X1 n=1 Tax=Herrania umbratica TaxID=108875 RepID=A0A6J0ZL92_9ROSI|nr:GDSL esterase/lipase At2g42990-like isoform X1 [Herrania umbratica]
MAHMNIPWIFFVQILVLASKSEAKVSAIIVFGDSSVDSGNNNYIPTIAKSNFEPYGRDFPGGRPTGRFCNGRLPPDFISEGFGLKPIIPAYLDPILNISDFASGVCFASAATGYDNATADILKVIPLWKEVEYYKEYQKKLRAYLGDKKANGIISEALYLISIGTNDFLENYYALPERQSQFTVQEYEHFVIGIAENFVRQIYGLGARKMSLTGLPPIGCLPEQRATNFEDPLNCVEERNKVALEFNGKLKVLVAKLNKELPGLKVFFADAYDLLLQLIQNPSQYGFEVAEEGCCGTGLFETGIMCNRHHPLTCTDANKYVFWDSIHPSQRTNKIISDNLLRAFEPLFL